MRFSAFLAGIIVVLATALSEADAQSLYWDIDGANPGAGGATPAGTWDTGTTPNWTTDPTGSSAATTWSAAANAVFSAGGDATGAYTVSVGGTQSLSALAVEEGTITQSGGPLDFGAVNGAIDIASGTSWTTSSGSVFAGTAGITKNGAGTLFLGSPQSYSAASGAILTVNGGVTDFSADLALGAAPAAKNDAAITLNGGTLRYSGTASLSLAANRGLTIGPLGGTIEVPQFSSIGGLQLTATATGGALAGSGVLTKTGAGRFSLNLTQTAFTGTFRILGGLLNVSSETRFGALPASPVADYLFMDGGGLRLSTTGTTLAISGSRGITLGAGGGKLIQPGPGILTVNSVIAGTLGGGLIIDWQDIASSSAGNSGGAAGGKVIFAAINTYDGPTTVDTGVTLGLNGTSTIGNGTGTLNLKGGGLTTSASRTAASAPIANPINMTASTLLNTTATGATPDLNFSSSSITATAGTLTIRNDSATAGSLWRPRFSGSGFDFTRPIDMPVGIGTGAATVELATFNPVGTSNTFSGVISGIGAFRRSASSPDTGGDTILSAANTYSGGTANNGGFIGFGNDSAIGTGTLTIGTNTSGFFASGGDRVVANPIIMNAATQIKGTNRLEFSGTISIPSSNRSITVTNTADSVLSGVISGAGGINKLGAGNLSATAANTYTGDTRIGAGTLSISNAYLADAADVYLATGSAFNLNFSGTPDTVDSLFVDNVSQAIGTWGAVGSGATHESPLITGSGLLLVSTFVPAGVPGDYNGNGTVDAADYVLWRKGVQPLQNEVAAPIGTTDSADYDAWRQLFGNTSGSGSGSLGGGSAVPEPSTLALMLLCISATFGRKRR